MHVGPGGGRTSGRMSAGIPLVMRDPMLRLLAAAYITNAQPSQPSRRYLSLPRHIVSGMTRWSAGCTRRSARALSWGRSRHPAEPRPGLPRSQSLLAPPSSSVPLAAFVFVTSLPLAMALLFISAVGATLYQTRGAVGLQQRMPRELLGRTMAVVRFAGYLGMLLGAIAAVSLVQPLGLGVDGPDRVCGGWSRCSSSPLSARDVSPG